MNREIKFRAWDGKDMLDIDHWTLSMINQHVPENHIIMQFTGLHDKKGKEIYEGDIIKVKHCIKPYGGEVYFDTNLARFAIKDKDVCKPLNFIGTPLGKKNIYEVIGNFTEHPELLKEGKNES